MKLSKNSPITFRLKEHKKETKIEYVKPDPNDWKTKYKLLNQTIEEWCTDGKTVGSFFYQKFYIEKSIERIRDNVVNRDWFEEEFDKIFDLQFEKHRKHFQNINIANIVEASFKDSKILNEVTKKEGIKEQLKYLIKDKIIYYQRGWKRKNIGRCKFEKIPDVNKDGKPTGNYIGRTVIPRSHPLHQEFKIWQQINNVRLWYHSNNEKPIELMNDAELCFKYLNKYPYEIKNVLYKKLQEKKELSWQTFANENLNLNIKINENYNKQSKEGYVYYSVNFIKKAKNGKEQDNKLKGNTTKIVIKNILKDKDEEWFNSIIRTGSDNHKEKI